MARMRIHKAPSPRAIHLLLVVLCVAQPALSAEITDDAGHTVSLAQPAKRIIPLYGAFAETLYTIGAGPYVVARTQADEYPEAIRSLPSVGTHMRPNVEMILALKPDLVIQSATRAESLPELERLRDAGIPVAVFHPKTFGDIFSVMERLGVLTGRESEARAQVVQLQGRLEAVRHRVSQVSKPLRVFFEVRAEPLTGAGRGSIVQEILTVAGAENVLKAEKAIVQVGLETLLVENPDAYIVQVGPMNKNPLDPGKRAHFQQVRSVREGRVLFMDEFTTSRPGPRCVDAAEELARWLCLKSGEAVKR